ncbi:L,D-transpeptidase [Ancylobacter sp. G4_0304]|uniref:L,D-transpeptidase n=1 Tax=Ancylobacter sp. G4_0304 TaxID=3114289 RepID=UPI0039C6F128
MSQSDSLSIRVLARAGRFVRLPLGVTALGLGLVFAGAPALAQGVYGVTESNYGVFSSRGSQAPARAMPSRTAMNDGGRWRPGGANVYPPAAVTAPRPPMDVGAGYGGPYRSSGGYREAPPADVYGAAPPRAPRGNITVQTRGGGIPAPEVYTQPRVEQVAAVDADDYDYDDEDAPLPVYRASAGAKGVDPKFNRKVVRYTTGEARGTIIVDTGARFLYLVQGDGTAVRYGIGVGREGFGWTGTQRISRKAEWPDWRPPAEMVQRRPDLPNYMPGGEDNPLGARALYLGDTLYRIHGSNEPDSIGQAVSSGCFRMRNQDVIDLYNRVGVGTVVKVI